MATTTPAATLVAGSMHPLWLRGFLSLAATVDNVEVVGHASEAPVLLDLLEQHRPAMLVIDSTMLEPVRALLRSNYSIPRILVVGRPMHAGTRPIFGPSCSCGYFTEREAEWTIATLVDEVARCQLPRPGLAACADCRVPRSFRPPSLPLTEREHEIFVRIGWGIGPSEIAAELGIHVKTIETHRESMKRKLGLSSATELLDAAFKWRDGEPLPRFPRETRDGEPS